MAQLIHFDLIVLFFFLGVFASWIKSDLVFPDSVSKFLSIFLLLSLGLKGGHAVKFGGDLTGFLPALILGLLTCLLIPLILFRLLKKRLGVANGAALAMSYGSVSAVTFIAGQNFLESQGFSPSGYMVAIMAMMEIPALLIGLGLYYYYRGSFASMRELLRSVVATKSFILLIGGFLIGLLMNEKSWQGISPVVSDCFKGVLVFFLIDLGAAAQKQLALAWKHKLMAFFVAILIPLALGSLCLVVAHRMGLQPGNQVLLALLTGSASYIAAPATVRSTMSDANPSLYLGLPLALTFPMNLIFGIPFYMKLSQWL